MASAGGRRPAVWPNLDNRHLCKHLHKQAQLDRREQCKGKAKGAQFFCALAGYDPAYCLDYRLKFQQVCELDQ